MDFLKITKQLLVLSMTLMVYNGYSQWYKSGLVAHYAFDSLSTVDSSASMQHLTGVTQLQSTTNRKNQPEKAIAFPDPQSTAQGSAIHLPAGNDDRTLSIWLRIDQLPTPPDFAFVLFYGQEQDGKGMGIAFDGQGRMYAVGYRSSASSQVDLPSNSLASTAQWLHVGITYDGDTAKLYLNGQLDAVGQKNWNTSPNSTLLIGRLGNATGGTPVLPFEGAIDDFRVYDRELSAEEIDKLANDDFSALSNLEVHEPEYLSSADVYPNPTSGMVYIDSEQEIDRIRLQSLDGRLLKEVHNQDYIEISDRKAGLYLITYTLDGTPVTHKILKY